MDKYIAGKKEAIDNKKLSKYEYFLPSLINKGFDIKNDKIFIYLENAARLLGELNSYGDLIPDINFFIMMHVASEAVSSSKIEGTKTELDEVILSEEEIDPEKRDDWLEVKNYIKAMNESISGLGQLPVSIRLIKNTHKILLSEARGENKSPGEIRKSQNWIGGSSIDTAQFIPPHHSHLSDLLSDWEKFWHNENILVPTLIKIAIGHYQFETIHPFLDGNGRIGRLLIVLQLIERGFLKYPILYISNFFEKNRQSYYDSLNNVRTTNNLEQWIIFFLEAVIETAKKSKMVFEKIIKLRKDFEDKVSKLGKKNQRGRILLEYLFSNPVVKIDDVSKHLNVNYPTANRLVSDFVNLGILIERTGFSRNRLFGMDSYIKLFKDK